MRLVTFERSRQQRVGAVLPAAGGGRERIVDLVAAARYLRRRGGRASRLETVGDMVDLLAAGAPGLNAARRVADAIAREVAGGVPTALRRLVLDRARARLCAPVPRPPKFICVGLNYRDHAEEGGHEIPAVPTLFNKFATSVAAPGERIVLPAASKFVDYEGEFAFVIGTRGRNVAKSRAMDHVAGYTIVNDVSARDWQGRTTQWLSGKAWDQFGAMGPELVTRDEIRNPHALDLKTWVSGELMQSSNTRQLIFRVPELVADISTFCTLEPGDVVSTGTPAGVGFYRTPPRPLRDGDTCHIEIAGLGALENGFVAEKRRGRRAAAKRARKKAA